MRACINGAPDVGVGARGRVSGGVSAEQDGLGIFKVDLSPREQGPSEGLPLLAVVTQHVVGEGNIAHVGEGDVTPCVHGAPGIRIRIHDGFAVVEGKVAHVREGERFSADGASPFVVIDPAVAVDGGTIVKAHGHSRAGKCHDGLAGGPGVVCQLIEEDAACEDGVFRPESGKAQVLLQGVSDAVLRLLARDNGALIEVFSLLGCSRLRQGGCHQEKDGGYCKFWFH